MVSKYFLYSLMVFGHTVVQSFHFQIISCLGNSNIKNYKLQSPPLSFRGYTRKHSKSSNDSRLYSEKREKNNGKTKFGKKTNNEDVSRFLSDYRTADGTLVDPYKILQVSRSATTAEIKQSYRRLSRKLHPDMVAQMEVLPGRCTNLEDVRNEWEKVKFSYEILSDAQMRKNYDRNSSVAEVLNDPGAAVGRAVVGGAMSGLGLVLGGAWKIGEMAAKTIYETAVVVVANEGSIINKSSEVGFRKVGLSKSPDMIGERIDGNINLSNPQPSTMPMSFDVNTDQASSDVETSVMLSNSRRDSSNISVLGSQINPSKLSSEELSCAVETASYSVIQTREGLDGGRDANAINLLTVNNAGIPNKKRTPRKGTKGFGK